GFSALPFNGKMDSTEKIANQNAFIQGEAQIIVATSAFGMGVDKKDVKLVIHYIIDLKNLPKKQRKVKKGIGKEPMKNRQKVRLLSREGRLFIPSLQYIPEKVLYEIR
ncbi:MAG: hypothetical protein IJU29_08175, partial [Oscillospiraceae bacterium]|nr:hypothetical protein [Oscillospiraceae bacterium]